MRGFTSSPSFLLNFSCQAVTISLEKSFWKSLIIHQVQRKQIITLTVFWYLIWSEVILSARPFIWMLVPSTGSCSWKWYSFLHEDSFWNRGTGYLRSNLSHWASLLRMISVSAVHTRHAYTTLRAFRSPSLEACNSHTKPTSPYFYRPVYSAK